jgi:hypothetical protein
MKESRENKRIERDGKSRGRRKESREKERVEGEGKSRRSEAAISRWRR